MRWCYFAPSAPGVSVKTGLHGYGSNAVAVGASWKPGALIMATWSIKGEEVMIVVAYVIGFGVAAVVCFIAAVVVVWRQLR